MSRNCNFLGLLLAGLSAFSSGVSFASDVSVTVSGRVTDSVTLQGVESVQINALGGGSARPVAMTDVNGYYSGTVILPEGSYFFDALVLDSRPYLTLVYPDVWCVSYPCSTQGGTPFSVLSPQTLTNLDFSIELGGRLEVHVEREDTHAPLANVQISVSKAIGGDVLGTFTDAAGNLFSDVVLPAANYRVRTSEFVPGYVGEVYNNHECPGFCDPAIGDDVVITPNGTSPITMSLRSGVTLSGRVTDTSAVPLPASISVYDSNGMVSGVIASADGNYTTSGDLQPGTYTVLAQEYDHVQAVYPGITCFPCDPFETGTHITVGSTSLSGIDIVLERGSRFTGAITLPEGAGSQSYVMDVYRADGTEVPLFAGSGGEGYIISAIAPGDYYAIVRKTPFANYVGEMYLGVPCYYGSACDLAQGTLIHTEVGQTTTGIDFVLRTDAVFAGSFDSNP
jgi:hypothetical protein